jgi:glutamate synthase (NADPH) small chain
MAATIDRPLWVREPRPADPSSQDSLASRYPAWVRWVVMAAFALAFLGWLNESWLFLWDSPIWLNRYTEYAIILAFGIWRIGAERNRYTRKRLIILVSVVTRPVVADPLAHALLRALCGLPLVPAGLPGPAHAGDAQLRPGPDPGLPVRAAGHCGFGCPCVGIRETVGFAYRSKTLRGPWVWRLRHAKWLFFVWYAAVMVATQFPPNAWTVSLVGASG